MKHRALVHVLLLLWGLCASRLVYATTFAHEVRDLDYMSLLTAGVAGLCGGALRTIFTLANDNRAVFDILKEARKDMIVSCLAGGAAYLFMIAIESKWPGTVTREIRFVGVMAAGWTRAAIFTQAARLVRAKVDGKAKEYRNANFDDEPPSSASVPLEK